MRWNLLDALHHRKHSVVIKSLHIPGETWDLAESELDQPYFLPAFFAAQ